MPNSNNPQVPNFTPGVGRLVTDRYDFQSHIDGANFRHNATMIDMSPIITINGQQPNTVQDSIEILASILVPPTIQQATVGNLTTNLGIITLGGDLGGVGSTALFPKVGGLQGRPISAVAPASGQFLAFNTNWIPVNLSGNVTGGYNSTIVSAISSSSPVPINSTLNAQSGSSINMLSGSTLSFQSGSSINGNINWVSTTVNVGFNPEIVQSSPTTDVATGNLLIQAADAYISAITNQNGGNITISTGNPTGIGDFGLLTLQVGHGAFAQPVLSTNISNNTLIYGGYSSPNIVLTSSQTEIGAPGYTSLVASYNNISLFPTSGTAVLQQNFNWTSPPGYTLNTQMEKCQNYSYVFTTTSSSAQQVSNTFNLPNGYACLVECKWIRRNSAGGNVWGGYNAFICQGASGSIGANPIQVNAASPTGGIYQGGTTSGLNTEILINQSTNSFWIQCEPPTSTSTDWTLFVNLNFS